MRLWPVPFSGLCTEEFAMRGWSVLVAVVLVPAVAADEAKTPPEGWKEVKGGYRKQAYAVWVPADGKLDESNSSIVAREFGQIRIFRTVCERKDGSVLAAGQILLPPKLTKAPPRSGRTSSATSSSKKS